MAPNTMAVSGTLIISITSSVATSNVLSMKESTKPRVSKDWIGWIEPMRERMSPTWRRSK